MRVCPGSIHWIGAHPLSFSDIPFFCLAKLKNKENEKNKRIDKEINVKLAAFSQFFIIFCKNVLFNYTFLIKNLAYSKKVRIFASSVVQIFIISFVCRTHFLMHTRHN